MIKNLSLLCRLVPVFLLFSVNAAAETLVWDWPPDSLQAQNQCVERTCQADDSSLQQNLGKPCTQAVPGEKCVVSFEYHVLGRIFPLQFAEGDVSAAHCGQYREDLGDAVTDVYDPWGNLIDETRGKYTTWIRSMACDGSRSEWVNVISGDEPYCVGIEKGDVNGDGVLDVNDFTAFADYLFNQAPAPACIDSADIQDDGLVGILDLIILFLML